MTGTPRILGGKWGLSLAEPDPGLGLPVGTSCSDPGPAAARPRCQPEAVPRVSLLHPKKEVPAARRGEDRDRESPGGQPGAPGRSLRRETGTAGGTAPSGEAGLEGRSQDTPEAAERPRVPPAPLRQRKGRG